MSSANLTLKTVNKLASLAYTVSPNCGIFGPEAQARTADPPFSCRPTHPMLSVGGPSQDIAPRGSDTLIPLACSIALTPQMPTRNFLNLLQSLRPFGPVSNFKVLHSRPL